MHKIGQLFHRSMMTIMMILLVLVLAAPSGGVGAQAGAPMSDDFNTCSLRPGWTFENPANVAGAAPTFPTAFTADSKMQLAVPAGQVFTFSDKNTDAPRIMQTIADANFNVEVGFVAPMETAADNWKIAGLLVQDATGTKTLRFDFNVRSSVLKGYAGYLDTNTNPATLTHFANFDLDGSNPTSGLMKLNINYTKGATNSWTVTWWTNKTVDPARDVRTFTSPAGFVPGKIGIFVGSTEGVGTPPGTPPGNTILVDYFQNMASPLTDDSAVLTLTTAGAGTGVVNRSCAGGTNLTLTAVPAVGSSFGGWSGAVTSSSPTITVNMTQARSLVATFNQGGVNQRTYMPVINR